MEITWLYRLRQVRKMFEFIENKLNEALKYNRL